MSQIVLDRDGPGWRQPEIDHLTAALLRPPVFTFDPDRLRFSVAGTDDYPKVQVELRDAGGRRITASSNGMIPLMLPWNVDAGHGAVATYDPAIPRAMRPPVAGTVNQTRDGDGWFEACIVSKIGELPAAANEKAAHGGP